MSYVESFTLEGDLYEYEKLAEPVLETLYGSFHIRDGVFDGRVQPFEELEDMDRELVESGFEVEGYRLMETMMFPQAEVDEFGYRSSYVVDGERLLTIGRSLAMDTRAFGDVGASAKSDVGAEVYEGALPEPRDEWEEWDVHSVLPVSVLDEVFLEADVERVYVVD